jgi:hypothetical protein
MFVTEIARAEQARTRAPSAVPPIVHDVLRGPTTFASVRVHADGRAAVSAEAVGARAYAVGSDIVFGRGEYAPRSPDGRRLLAHELAHVVQQSGATPASAPAVREDDRAEREARVAADSLDGRGPALTTAPAGPHGIMREVISANPSPSGGGGKPPAGLTGCHVFLGGRLIDHWTGTILGFRHLYLDVFEGPSSYALIEAGPIGPVGGGGTSGAWVKSSDWDARGVQWEIKVDDCPAFIACLKKNTAAYHAAAHPYHYSNGPNSNSFIWWVLNECGVDISFLFSGWPYLGVDYWRTHSAAPAPTPARPPLGPRPWVCCG